MKHLDELTATLRMTLMFMLALLGIAWGLANLFTLMWGITPVGAWTVSAAVSCIVGFVLLAKWRTLQTEDELKRASQRKAAPAQPSAKKAAPAQPSTQTIAEDDSEAPVIVDQLETGQFVLAGTHERKAVKRFRLPASSFVSVLNGLPSGGYFVIQVTGGQHLCAKRDMAWWDIDGVDDIIFDRDRRVVRYARIDTSESIGVT